MTTEVQSWAHAMGTEGILLLGVALERHEQMSIHSNRAPVTGHTKQPINKSHQQVQFGKNEIVRVT